MWTAPYRTSRPVSSARSKSPVTTLTNMTRQRETFPLRPRHSELGWGGEAGRSRREKTSSIPTSRSVHLDQKVRSPPYGSPELSAGRFVCVPRIVSRKDAPLSSCWLPRFPGAARACTSGLLRPAELEVRTDRG